MDSRCLTFGLQIFEREDYPRLRAALADATHMPATFDDWRDGAEDFVDGVLDSGNRLHLVLVRSAVFSAWCEEHDLAPTHDNLNLYGKTEFKTWFAQNPNWQWRD